MMSSQSETRQRFIKAKPGVKLMGRKGRWYRCAYCGKWCGRSGGDNIRIKPNDLMEVDHIVPWSKGGSDEIYNLQPLCRPCNRGKSNADTYQDSFRKGLNTVTHPIDALIKTPLRKGFRQNKTLKKLGINKRK